MYFGFSVYMFICGWWGGDFDFGEPRRVKGEPEVMQTVINKLGFSP